ncbi:MAG: GyrI-like domain-containing protein [Mariprofundaceae bacterium]
MQEQANPPSKKLLVMMIIGLMTTLGGSALIMLYLGAFKDPEVFRATPQGYRIAYLSHKGAYSNIEPLFEQVAAHLKQANIEPVTPCALFLDATSAVREPERRSKVGYLVKRTDYIPAPLEEEIIPAREVVTATFDGGTLLGSHKAYSAMREWARNHGYTLLLPALEIYHPSGTVEYQMPIHR